MKKGLSLVFTILLLAQLIFAVHAWEIERPNFDEFLFAEAGYKTVRNKYTDGNAAVGLGIAFCHYIEHYTDYDNHDYINMNVSMTANAREGITYEKFVDDYYWIDQNQLSYRNEDVIRGDNNGTWIDIPQDEFTFEFRFYGGLYSFEYRRVWVCTNGFISFDSTNSTSSYPSDIPSAEGPNALVAALWTDLEIDENAAVISGIYDDHDYSRQVFVVMWKNAKLPNGNRVTFEVILENAPGWYPAHRRATQSKIWISYESADMTGITYSYGIENIEGLKGSGQKVTGGYLHESASKCYEQQSNPFYLKRLILTFSDTNPNTRYRIIDDRIRGYHLVEDPDSEPDSNLIYVTAFAGGVTLLMGLSGVALVITVGVCIESILVTVDAVEALAYHQRNNIQSVDKLDSWTNSSTSTAYISAPTLDRVVDATLSNLFHWILDDPNNEPHSLTVTAKAEYREVLLPNGTEIDKPPICTSVTLNINPDDNDSFNSADTINWGTYSGLYLGGTAITDKNDVKDYYKIYCSSGPDIIVKMTPPDNDNGDFDLYLYAPNQTLVDSSTNIGNEVEYIQHTIDCSGYWFIEVRKNIGHGFYKLEVTLHSSGGGCPTLFVWNGTGYDDFGVIDIHAQEDVVKEVSMSAESVGIDGYKAYFRLQEGWEGLNYSHSELDQVKLYAVVNQNRYPCPLIKAIHSELGNVWLRLLLSDDSKVDTYLLEAVDLTFFVPYQNVEGFVFVIEGCNIEKQM